MEIRISKSESSSHLHGHYVLPPLPPPQKVTNFFIEEILKPTFGSHRKRPDCSTRGHHTDSHTTTATKTTITTQQKQHKQFDKIPPKCVQGTKTVLPDPARKSTADSGTAWPAWVYCTRYSDRPSSGPRVRKIKKKSREGDVDLKRPRTAFTNDQLQRLKREFDQNRYLTEQRRQELAAELGLNESQIKIWFQNKRAKLKKSGGERNELARQLMAEGLYNHATVPITDEDDEMVAAAADESSASR